MEYIDLIENYLSGELKQEDKLRFEEKMHLNSELASDVRTIKGLNDFLSKYHVDVSQFNEKNDTAYKNLLLEEWADPNNGNLVALISKLRDILGYMITPEVLAWLDSDAIFYPDLLYAAIEETQNNSFENGLMTPEEKLVLYGSLLEAYSMYNDIDQSVDEYLYQKRIEKVKETDNNTETTLKPLTVEINKTDEKEIKHLSQKFIFRIAASLAILVAVGSILWLTLFSTAKHETLYTEYYQTYSVPVELRGMTTGEQDVFTNGIKSFDNREYAQALKQFSLVGSDDKNYLAAVFFTGLAHMELQQDKLAVSALKQVAEGQPSNLRSDARWYLALCYIRLDDFTQSKKWLNEVVEANSFHKEKAGELLQKLN